jgi:SP family myo-inositol transporter-like MFS transporter 13
MIALDNVSVTLGQLLSYCLGAGFTHVSHGWRYLVAIGGIPPIILLFLLQTCPESPRQLVLHGKLDIAAAAIRKIYPKATEIQVQAKLTLIHADVEQENMVKGDKTLWWQFRQLHVVPSNFRALVCACAVMAISQLGGFNTLMYYSATLFAIVGFQNPTAVSIVVGATNFVFNIVNLLFIDRLGRRRLLLITVIGMSFCLAVVAVAFHWIPVSKDLTVETREVGWAGILVLIMIIFYIACFSGGVATIAWVGTELLPTEVRALGTMMNTVTCWGSNLVIASTFLSMMKGMTPSGAFGFYAGICFLGWLFIIFFYPECSGLPLEDVWQVFEHGFGVKKAREMQRERKQKLKEGDA